MVRELVVSPGHQMHSSDLERNTPDDIDIQIGSEVEPFQVSFAKKSIDSPSSRKTMISDPSNGDDIENDSLKGTVNESMLSCTL